MAENPAVVEYRRVLVTTYAEVGQFLVDLIALASVHRGIVRALAKQAKRAAGLESLRWAVAIVERIARQDSLAAYDLACTLARCGEMAAALPASAEDGGPESARRYAERAVAGLRQAIAAERKDVDWMERDPELRVLHDRDDFRDVIRSLRPATAPGSK